MKKISTLFKKDPNDLGRVINEINPENQWVIDGEGIATRKLDGTACAVINGALYKRYDVKKGRQVPENAIPCQEPDAITGHWPHWVQCDINNKADQYHFEAFDYPRQSLEDGTYELIGPKVQGNPEEVDKHYLVKHGTFTYSGFDWGNFEAVEEFLLNANIEGIVFHHKTDGRMCKIRKSDFGIKRKRIYEPQKG